MKNFSHFFDIYVDVIFKDEAKGEISVGVYIHIFLEKERENWVVGAALLKPKKQI